MVGNYAGKRMESYVKSQPKVESARARREREAAERYVDGEGPLPRPGLGFGGASDQLPELKRTRSERWNNTRNKTPRAGSAVSDILRAAEAASNGKPYSAYEAASTIEKAAMYGAGAALVLAALPEAAAASLISSSASALEILGNASMASVGIPVAESMLATEAVTAAGGATLLGGASVAGKAYNSAARFFGRGVESTRVISSVERVSSNVVNKPFLNEKALSEGWQPPYPADLSLREITIGKETKFYRVHTDINRPAGRFLAREKEISPYLNNPEALRLHLGLPDVPIYITEVNVPSGARLLTGRIGAQPTFGLMEMSGFQYQLTSKIPESSFANTRLILNQKLNPGIGY